MNYTDMNECALGNGGCDHQCVNTGGSFSCECRPGYELQADGHSCRLEGVCVCVGGDVLLVSLNHYYINTVYSWNIVSVHVEEPCYICLRQVNIDGLVTLSSIHIPKGDLLYTAVQCVAPAH